VEHQPASDRPALELAREFQRAPLGHHSPALARVLRVLRSEPHEGKHVIVCTKPYQEYRLGRLSARRGEPVALVPGLVYGSREDAEWAVFSRRWEQVYGGALDEPGGRGDLAGEPT
jgi:hypothetical protein